jgi:glycosyltransferase involved in cell wall biosynthesis
MALLPRHIETMRPWFDLPRKFIVVDSESTDGTVELLRRELPEDRTQFLQHPPGLYQSWNRGIQEASARYLYVSTVGDMITRDGLLHLVETAERFSPDVVISPPDFVDEKERPIWSKPWPVHRIIAQLSLTRTMCIEGPLLFACALSYIPFAILGSSASNLYRTNVLCEKPFPTEYGPNGDGAWGIFNALTTRLAITPKRVSFFRQHDRPYRDPQSSLVPKEERMFACGLRIWEEALRSQPRLKAEVVATGLNRLIRAKRDSRRWRSVLLQHRSLPWPWFMNPVAWYARIRRNRAQYQCDALLQHMLLAALGSDANQLCR